MRAVIFNDSYEPVQVWRNALVGPNVRGVTPGGYPRPDSVEPTFGQAEEPILLQPFTFYGRERQFGDLEPGDVDVAVEYSPKGGDRLSASKRLVIDKA